jgi:hypothetical protein
LTKLLITDLLENYTSLMLAAAPSPRGSDADLSIAGYVVGGFHDESLPSRHDS